MKKAVLLVVVIFMLLTLCASLACGFETSMGKYQPTAEKQDADNAIRRANATMDAASPTPSD